MSNVPSVECTACKGAGRVGEGYLREDCPPCGGTGRVPARPEGCQCADNGDDRFCPLHGEDPAASGLGSR
jgi:RecJ-like exonuclease